MALTQIRPGVQFRPDAAASFRRLERALGRLVDVNRTVVSYGEQMNLYKLRQAGKYPYSVAHPDASNHVYRSDTDGGNAWDTDERGAELEEHGWIAVWNDPNREPYEPWHREYLASRDKHRNAPTSLPLAEQDDDMNDRITYARDKATNGQGSVYAVDTLRGTKRPVSKGEWSTIRATIPGVKVADITASDLATIPNG